MKPLLFAFILAGALAIGPASAQEVKVTGDSFTVNEATSEAVFSGNVAVVHPTVKVWADKVEVRYGDGGPTSVQSFTASGHVRLQTSEQTATGERAVFDPATQILRLTGNVKVTNASGTVGAPELVVDIKNNTSTFTGNKGGRVTGVFTTP